MTNLGAAYVNGWCVQKDYHRAARYFEEVIDKWGKYDGISGLAKQNLRNLRRAGLI